MTNTRKLALAGMMLIGVGYGAGISRAEAGKDPIFAAPLNPEFVEYTKQPLWQGSATTADGHGLGHRPGPVDLSHTTGQQVAVGNQLMLTYPAFYDLRTITNKLSPIRDQRQCGSCWVFGTYGSLESCLRPGEIWDFSEMDMNCSHGYDWLPCDGGNMWISTAFLARWDGPVNETCYPYPTGSSYACTSPRPSCARQKHVQEVLFIPGRSGPLDNDNIKNAVTTYGAVDTTIYWADASYKASTYSYYYSGTGGNHDICIVGWDDNYDKNKFATVPAGNGAFIMRNSWGSSWGQSGYFYISYYDTIVGSGNAVFLSAEPTTNYTREYQYDPYGWINDLGCGATTAWFSNMFVAAASEQLKAVSFYTVDVNCSYELYVYTNCTSGAPRSGTLAASKTGSYAYPGYHTVVLTSPASLTSGQRFSLVVKMTTSSYGYPIAFEYPYAGYCSAPTANPGESYASCDGTSWTDVTSISGLEEANVCLKGFAGPSCQALAILSSNSVKMHGTCGDYGVPSGSWEGRVPSTAQQGPSKIVTVFNQGIQRVNSTAADFTFSSGTLGTVTISTTTVTNDTLTVNLTNIANKATFTIGYPGIAAACDVGNKTTATNCWVVLAGEASGPGTGSTITVNTSDYVSVRGRIGPGCPTDFRKDVNCSGAIDTSDYVSIRGRIDPATTLNATCP